MIVGRHPLYSRIGGWAILVAALALPAAAQAPPALSVQDRAYLERLALAKARSGLVAAVHALPLDQGRTIGDWLGGQPALDRGLRLWLRQREAAGETRFFNDATIEVDVRVRPEGLVAILLELQTRYPPPTGAALPRERLERYAMRWSWTWSTGVARLDERTAGRRPLGWEDVSVHGEGFARKAAEADAVAALLEEAGRLMVSPTQPLVDFIESGSAVCRAIRDGIAARATVESRLAPDQLAVAEARLSRGALVEILTDVHAAHYGGQAFTVADLRSLAARPDAPPLEATGLAPPPERYLLTSRAPRSLDAPTWATQSLRVTGRFVPSAGDAAASPADARTAARLDAIGQLNSRVLELVIQDGVTVAAWIGQERQLKPDVVTFLSSARIVRATDPDADGIVTVEVELPLGRLWQIVRRPMERIELRPDEVPAADQPIEDQS